MTGGMALVRDFYGVPARRGREVVFDGTVARITSSTGSHLYLRDAAGRRIGPCHPLWRMDYRDGIDYAARHDERVERFVRALRGER